jgi:hypothetical protein
MTLCKKLLCDTKSGQPYLAMAHLLLVEELLATQDLKNKLSSTCNGIMEATKHGNKMLMASIDDIHTMNLEIEKRHLQDQTILQNQQIDYLKFVEMN